MEPEVTDRLRRQATTPFTVDTRALYAAHRERDLTTANLSVKILSAVGGFFASLLFLLALWLADILDEPVAAVGLGTTLLVLTIILGRHRREAFVASITVCGYLVGVGLTMLGLLPQIADAELVLPVLGIATLTLIFTRNYFLVLLAVVSLPACLLYLELTLHAMAYVAAAIGLGATGLVALSFTEHHFVANRRLPAVRAGLALGLLLSLCWYRWGHWMADEPYERYGVLPISLLLYVLVASVLGCSLPRRWAALAGLALLPLTLLPLLLGSGLLLLVSFRSQHFTGMGLGVAALLYFTAQYYYDLRWNLLDKSLVLLAAGALLLGLYYYLQRKFPAGVAD